MLVKSLLIRKSKLIIYSVIKAMGGFHLFKYLSRRKLQILCYHGVALHDENHLDGILFMRPEIFKRRLEVLKKWNMNVVPLDEAINHLPQNKLADNAVVITFDDGWYSTLIAASILKEYNYPSTVYVSTYYAQKKVSVMNMVVTYLFWKSGLGKPRECWDIMEKGNRLGLQEQARLMEETALQLGIDLDPIERKRVFHLMKEEEMLTLKEFGMDLQLHSHRHRLPVDQAIVYDEIQKNREALEQIRPGNYTHFCYPGGFVREAHLQWLQDMGVKSATTTDAGFNTPETPLLRLKRFLDRDQLSDLEFEAQICGVNEYLSLRFNPTIGKTFRKISQQLHLVSADSGTH